VKTLTEIIVFQMDEGVVNQMEVHGRMGVSASLVTANPRQSRVAFSESFNFFSQALQHV